MHRALLVFAFTLTACATDAEVLGPDGKPTKPTTPAEPSGANDKDGTRLKRLWTVWTGPDGARLSQWTGQWRDTKLNIDCAASDQGNGMFLCLPGSASIQRVYTDDKCTGTPVDAAMTVTACGSPSPPEWVSRQTSLGCSNRVTELYQRPTLHRLPKAYQLSGTTCVDFSVAPTIGWFQIDALGRTMLPAEFASLSRTTEVTP